METPKIFESEYRFCLIMWEHAPIAAAELAKLCLEQLGWKRTTTYTVLKRLCNGGLFKMENSEVSVVLTRDEFYATQSENYVKENFSGSLPAFLTAFTQNRKLSKDEVDEIKKMIKSFEEK